MGYTEEENKLLERQSMENLVENYREELLQIIGGGDCCTLLPRGVRRRMRRDGILSKVGHRYEVGLQGRDLLAVVAEKRSLSVFIG